MQTSKITVGNVYAVKLYGGDNAVRFRVDAIVTRKDGSRTESTIEGVQVGDDAQDRKKHTIEPKDILGDYTEFAELAAKAAAEKAARDADVKAKQDAAAALVSAFYNVTGLTRDAKEEYRSPFRTSYGGGVEIKQEAVGALLKFLQRNRVAA